VLLLTAAGLTATASIAAMKTDTLVVVTAAGERTITVELAQSPDEMALGLMYRTSLAEGQGMLFPSPAEREVSMWMRNTYIPLDMIFIRANGMIHRIETMTEPLSEAIVSSNGPVLAVLELAGGGAARLGIKPGDQVRHPIFAPRR
jgi:uncharacterized protein